MEREGRGRRGWDRKDREGGAGGGGVKREGQEGVEREGVGRVKHFNCDLATRCDRGSASNQV